MNIKDYIIFENSDFIAVNKTAGLLTIPDREGKEQSLKGLLKQVFNGVYTVHRLDRDTTGIVVFARNETTHKELSVAFESREVEKHYVGLVLGKPAEPVGTIDAPIAEHPVKKGVMTVTKKGKSSRTDYEVLESFRFYSWLNFQIHTGRTHQIRVHMKHIGHPIVCDGTYGDAKPVFISTLKKKYNLSKSEEEERPILSRLALHSRSLSFRLHGQQYTLEAELPKDLRALLQQLRKNS